MTALGLRGDARALPLPDCSVDAVVCDPPYGLEFMGKEWDSFRPSSARLRTRVDGRTNPADGKSTVTTPEAYVAGAPFQAWCRDWAAEALRVLKPGGWLLAFGGTRTAHRLVCGIEDAGFEIRDSITWLYGAGFPKSLDVSKAIDKAAGAEREVLGLRRYPRGEVYKGGEAAGRSGAGIGGGGTGTPRGPSLETAPATPDAQQWSGWGTALKPASEPIVVARKPLVGTVAANVVAYGTGALNIDACRVAGSYAPAGRKPQDVRGGKFFGNEAQRLNDETQECHPAGRWPANVVLDEHTAADLDAQSGNRPSGAGQKSMRTSGWYEGGALHPVDGNSTGGDSGGASRFFPVFRYQAKAPTRERPVVDGVAHPTVKPVELMRWLCRLVTQPGGLILDPFAGSGTTVEAAMLEGFDVIGVERNPEYLPLIQHRIDRASRISVQGDLLDELAC